MEFLAKSFLGNTAQGIRIMITLYSTVECQKQEFTGTDSSHSQDLVIKGEAGE